MCAQTIESGPAAIVAGENRARESSVMDIISILKAQRIPTLTEVVVDPLLAESDFDAFKTAVLDLVKRFFDRDSGSRRVSAGQGCHLQGDERDRFSEYVSLLDINDIHVRRISGAMTNCVYFVSLLVPARIEPHATNEHIVSHAPMVYTQPELPARRLIKRIVLRIYGREASEFIRRDREIYWVTKLSKQGVSPAIVGIFGNGRMEQHLNSKTLTKDDIRLPHYSKQIAAALLKVHTLITESPTQNRGQSEMWARLENWYHLAKKALKQCKTKNIKRYNRIVELIGDESEINSMWSKLQELKIYFENGILNDCLVFSHNDLQYGNILSLIRRKRYDSTTKPTTDRSNLTSADYNKDVVFPDQPQQPKPIAVSASSRSLLSHLHDDDDTGSHITNLTNPISEDLESDTDAEECGLALVDFEYSGVNYRCYDFANHFCEWMADYHCKESHLMHKDRYPTLDQQKLFMESYLDACVRDLTEKEILLAEHSRQKKCTCHNSNGRGDSHSNDVDSDYTFTDKDVQEHSETATRIQATLGINYDAINLDGDYCAGIIEDLLESHTGGKMQSNTTQKMASLNIKSRGACHCGQENAAPIYVRRFKYSDANVSTLIERTNKFVVLSHAHWALWGIIQCGVDEIDFDFIGYAAQRWQLFNETVAECK